MKKAVIFVRGNEIEAQVIKCKEYAATKGYEVLGVAETIREAFTASEDYQVLIVADMTRLSRRAEGNATIVEAFQDLYIEVEEAK